MRSSNALFRRRGRHTGVYYLELEHHTGDTTVDVDIEDVDGLQAALDSKADTADLVGYAPIASPAFTGAPTAPTPSPGDNDTSLATTAYVTAAVAAGGGGGGQPLDAGLTSISGLSGAGLVEATGTDVFAMRALGVGATTSVPTRADGDGRWLLQSSYTAADVLTKLLTVDGAGSTLDADLLDGQSGAYYLAYGNLTGVPVTFAPSAHSHIIADTTGLQTALDDKLPTASYTAADVLAKLLTVDGTGSGLDADTLDGQSSAAFQAAGSYQTLDATLTALAGLNATAGLVEQTGADAFTKRLIGVTNATDIPTRANGDARWQTAGSYQTLDATLTALAGLDTTAGMVEQTGTDTFAKRALGVAAGTSIPTRADADTRYQASGSYQTLDATLTAVAGLDATAGLVEQTGADAFTKRALGAAATTSVPTRADGDVRWAQLAAANTFTAAQITTLSTVSAVPLTLISTEAAAAAGPFLDLRRDSASPAAADLIGVIRFLGKDTAAANTTYVSLDAAILNATDGATEAGRLQIVTRTAGANNNCAYFGGGVYLGAATGSDKGVGTLNATAVYDDNVILTCMPLQPKFRRTGRVDLKKWDRLAPNGHHAAAHKFAEMLASGFDPRNPQNYIARAKGDAALPGMPTLEDWQHGEISTGEMITRLWLAVELLATAWMAAEEKREQPT